MRWNPLDNTPLARRHLGGPLILNDGYDFDEAGAAVAARKGEAVSFGRSFLGNPDIIERFRLGIPLNRFDPNAFYTPGPAGYTDCPAREP
jgi:2,4-dienoyl-CoA reductase-like NADH-dependent reductase (Old Yellow Enzyme family)